MGSQNPYIQQLRALDRSSPQVPDQLSALLDGKEHGENILSLPDQDAVWLVECLEEVRVLNPYVNHIFSRRCSFLTLSLPPVPPIRNAYAYSGQRAALGGYYQSRTHFRTLVWSPVPTR